MELEIVRAVPGEGAVLHALAEETFLDACPPGMDTAVAAAYVANELSAEHFEQWLEDGRHHILLLVEPGTRRSAAYLVLVADEPVRAGVPVTQDANEPLDPEATLWFVSKLYVVRESRGSGGARRLLEAGKSLAADAGASGLWLTVNQHNLRANTFYERNGFRTVATAEFMMGPKVHDDFVKVLRF
ncbi:GNAT family N-acetyltransferase [Kocuria sp. JC486]|uniref:GNAT family N-acetyltransferase n=1 Tax=Kocuria sp. JC486 TaxID=1970736 RepID=UPI0014229375|nr:GNAT family N-acetyltransferase [Kocuria sp. JC486]